MATFGISKELVRILLLKKHNPSKKHVEIMFAFLKFYEEDWIIP